MIDVAASKPMFVKFTGIELDLLPRFYDFLARDDIKTSRPVYFGSDVPIGYLAFVELVADHTEKDGTHTLEVQIHPYFRSWKEDQDPEKDSVRRYCPRSVIDNLFKIFNYFENP